MNTYLLQATLAPFLPWRGWWTCSGARPPISLPLNLRGKILLLSCPQEIGKCTLLASLIYKWTDSIRAKPVTGGQALFSFLTTGQDWLSEDVFYLAHLFIYSQCCCSCCCFNNLNWLPIHKGDFTFKKFLFPDVKLFGNTGPELPKAPCPEDVTAVILWWDMPTSIYSLLCYLLVSVGIGTMIPVSVVSGQIKGLWAERNLRFWALGITWAMSRSPEQRTEDTPYPAGKLK